MSTSLRRLVVVTLVSAGCGAVTSPALDGSADSHEAVDSRTPVDSHVTVDSHSGADSSADAGHLVWYKTCGYPVCGGPLGADAATGDAAACPEVGSTCTVKGAGCGTPTRANCGVTLLCDDHNPATMCPVSSRTFKDGIQYADEAALKRLHDETLSIKLATYTYKPEVADPSMTHLGFVIEDNPESQAVNGARARVDMYGYVSMVVASMQVQEKEIAALKGELETVRKDAAACRGGRK